MSEDNTPVEDSTEPKPFNISEAVEQSREFLAGFMPDILLHDPEKGEDLFIVAPPSMNEDGSLTILCASSEEPEAFVLHTLVSGYVSKEDIVFGEKPPVEEESKIFTPPTTLVGLDGQPLS